ncbi:hypothetical protein [Mangrovicella endophytica]|uniref:hypothetical protein n=1 Tax=Mangrovicella endophytica TaxID=2066697 RepID=UPI000C9E9DF7|nr:hypothetical protein [Mangrovicella endophytica]
MTAAFRILCIAAAMACSAAPIGHAADIEDSDQAAVEADDDDEGVETEDIFGFTEGADTGEAGEREIGASLLLRTGKDSFVEADDDDADFALGPDHYRAFSGALEFEYSVTDALKVSAEAAGVRFDQENVFEPGHDTSGGLGGLSGEIKYKLLDRATSPIGFALGAEVEWSRFDEVEGEREDSIGVELKAFADAELIPNTLFAAVNVSYEPEWSLEDDGSDEAEEAGEEDEEDSDKESGLEIAAALSARVADDFFLGGEARFLVAGEGLAFDEVVANAFYLGPTLYWGFADNAYLKAAWSIHVAGDARGDEDEFEEFERHQLLAQVGFEF